MSQRIYRVCRSIHAQLDGEGARLVGGRWNSVGTPMVYMAQSIALAVLENLVHMPREDFPVGYVAVYAVIPDDCRVMTEDEHRNKHHDMTTQELGDAWIASKETAILRVRSKVVPDEYNYLLNPAHPEFSRIAIEPPVPFDFDPRLFHY